MYSENTMNSASMLTATHIHIYKVTAVLKKENPCGSKGIAQNNTLCAKGKSAQKTAP